MLCIDWKTRAIDSAAISIRHDCHPFKFCPKNQCVFRYLVRIIPLKQVDEKCPFAENTNHSAEAIALAPSRNEVQAALDAALADPELFAELDELFFGEDSRYEAGRPNRRPISHVQASRRHGAMRRHCCTRAVGDRYAWAWCAPMKGNYPFDVARTGYGYGRARQAGD
jgi:hypothetical protein